MRRPPTRRSLLQSTALLGSGLLAGCNLQSDGGQTAAPTTLQNDGRQTATPTVTEMDVDPDVELFVAPDGSEDADGSEGAPFGSLDAALDRAGEAIDNGGASNGLAITLRGGSYPLDEGVRVSAIELGSGDVPVVVRSHPDERAVLRGGVKLPTEAFEPVSDEDVRAHLPETARDEVVAVDLEEHGITTYGELLPRGFGLPDVSPLPELFVDGESMTRARWPNEGWVRVGDVSNPGPEPQPRIAADTAKEPVDEMVEWANNGKPRPFPEYMQEGATFEYEDDRIESWENPEDAWLYGYWFYDWADGHLAVDSVDPEADTLTTETASWYNVRAGQRYYYYNVLEELDQPGEFYLDRDAGVLYLYPPTDLTDASVSFSTLTEPMLSLDGVSNVAIRDLVFDTARGTGVDVAGGEGVSIEHCTFRNLANLAVDADGSQHGVVGCRIEGTGAGGVSVTGGDRASLSPGENYVVNNDISNFSRIQQTYSPAVSVRGVGNYVANNRLHHAPHMALSFSGNEHVIEYNEIDTVCRETSDAGAIYTGRDWTQRGTVIRHNFIHHVRNDLGGHGQTGVYLDDMYSGTRVYGNVFYAVNRAMLVGGGRDNEIVNNLGVECEEGLRVDARAAPGNWAHENCMKSNGAIRSRLQNVPYKSDPWASTYPELVGILDDDPCLPKGNEVRRNVFVGDALSGVEFTMVDTAPPVEEYGTVTNNAAKDAGPSDHGFRYQNRTPSLDDDSIVPELVDGWESIPLEKIGLQDSTDAPGVRSPE